MLFFRLFRRRLRLRFRLLFLDADAQLAVHDQAGSGRNQMAHNPILLTAMVIIDLARESVDKAVQSLAEKGWSASGEVGDVTQGEAMEASFAAIAAARGERNNPGQVLIGFAAESHALQKNASEKIRKKNLDFIVANDITAPAAGFGADTNTVRILSAEGSVSEFAGTKEDVAEEIWNTVLADKQLS